MGFSDNLKVLLNHKGIKQAQLTDMLGITRTRISNYLSGKSEPDYAMLARIADLLDVTVDSLLDYKLPSEDVPLLFDYGFPDVLKSLPKEAGGNHIPVYAASSKPATEVIREGFLKQSYESQLFGYYALTMKDDSLEPDIKAGDMVYVKPCTKQDIVSIMKNQSGKVVCAFCCHENDIVGTTLLKCRFKDNHAICYNSVHIEVYTLNMPIKGLITGVWRSYK